MYISKHTIKQVLKKIYILHITTSLVRAMKHIRSQNILPFCAKYTFLSKLYYVFFGEFNREQQAVLNGILKHTNTESGINQYTLVRNIHRIEKGIAMPDRRPVFATTYLKETIASYEITLKQYTHTNESIHTEQLLWAYDVLSHYFSIVDTSDPIIDGCKNIFYSLPQIVKNESSQKKLPYKRKDNLCNTVQFQDLQNLAKQRRSIRWFLQKPVEREKIDQALSIAELSPSDCNRSPISFLIIDDPVLVKKIATIPLGTPGFAENIPVIVVVIGNLDSYPSERDRHNIYINTGLQSMAFMYALETLGLSTCPLNWPDIEEKERELQLILKLAPWKRPTLLMALGYADPEGAVLYSAKRGIAQARTYNI
ncbi:MAG: nitroreductase family protein [Candidatus Magasanikbacteria bacterium]|nr:nitroreductase family protein [Candidatus Magasanikbacteria bacterium]